MAKTNNDKGNRYGIGFFLKTGRINPSIRGHRKLQQYLKDIEDDLITEHGGLGQMSIKEEILIKTCVEGYGVILLATMFVRKNGIFSRESLKKGDYALVQVLDRSVVAYQNSLRLNLLALEKLRQSGGQRDELNDYIAKKYKKASGTSLKTPLIPLECKKS